MKLALATPRTLMDPFGWLEDLNDSMWASDGSSIPGRWRETAEAIEFQFDLPGIDRKDIHLVVEDSLLKVSGHRYFWEKSDDANAGMEYRTAVNLPDSADTNKIDAKLENGVLRVRLPKREEVRARSITVQ